MNPEFLRVRYSSGLSIKEVQERAADLKYSPIVSLLSASGIKS